MESLEKQQTSSIEISTFPCHVMTKEEKKQSKLKQKQRDKEYREKRAKTRKKAKELRKKFKSIDACMIYPSDIKIGSLEKCIYSNQVYNPLPGGTTFGHIDERYESMDGEKTFIRVNRDIYIDVDEINSNKDLSKVRNQICMDGGMILGGKFLSCSYGEIRIKRKTLRGHPYFVGKEEETPISIKQLKKIDGR